MVSFIKNSKISPLSEMMLVCAQNATIQNDYVSAIEHLIIVRSVDRNPEVFANISLIVLEAIEAYNLSENALEAKLRILSLIKNNEFISELTHIKFIFDQDFLTKFLIMIRSILEMDKRYLEKYKEMSESIVDKINIRYPDRFSIPLSNDELEWHTIKVKGNASDIKSYLQDTSENETTELALARYDVLCQANDQIQPHQFDDLFDRRQLQLSKNQYRSWEFVLGRNGDKDLKTDEVISVLDLNILREELIEALEDLNASLVGSNAYRPISRIAERYKSELSAKSPSIDRLYICGLRLANARQHIRSDFDDSTYRGYQALVKEALDSIIFLHGSVMYSTRRGRILIALEREISFFDDLILHRYQGPSGESNELLLEINRKLEYGSRRELTTDFARTANRNLLISQIGVSTIMLVGSLALGFFVITALDLSGIRGLIAAVATSVGIGGLYAFLAWHNFRSKRKSDR